MVRSAEKRVARFAIETMDSAMLSGTVGHAEVELAVDERSR